MFDDLRELYTDQINHHDQKPRNFRVMPDATRVAEGNNPLCGDHFTVFLKLEGDRICDASFEGGGCAMSKASASMMTDYLKGKTVMDARHCAEQFRSLATTGNADEATSEKFGAFSGVHQQPLRAKCADASLACDALSAQGRVCSKRPRRKRSGV